MRSRGRLGKPSALYRLHANLSGRLRIDKRLIQCSVGLLLNGCSEEQQNRLSRLGVTWLEGNYRVTYADGEHVKAWEVRDGKVTSEPEKGYCFFWVKKDKKSYYVQTPIARTCIEETP